ncbi:MULTISPECIES: hypothetical protein [Streptomyces]|uniref:hypothetical protein n=1 Tax=Streptomyces TaxID=1883 RepID=UPI00068B7253|nr:hypothetical protein [Streptomyces durhamensis]
MGERHSGDAPPGRRRAHPGGILSAPRRDEADLGGSGFEARLAAALRADDTDAEGERRAVAAFRAARATEAPLPRTRRRDDWRPAAPRRGRLSLRATLSVALASLALGGVAVAAIGSARSGPSARPHTPRPAHSSTNTSHGPAVPGPSAGPAGSRSPGPSARPDHPATARDTLAHCRTYERAGERGGALDSTAWQRLVTAAGGEDGVAAYCARVEHSQGPKGGHGGKPGKDAGRPAASPKPADAKPAGVGPTGVKKKPAGAGSKKK